MLRPSRLPGLPRTTGGRVVAIGVLLVAVQVGLRAWALAGSWFYFDDLAFMSRAMNQGFGWAYLTESYGGHLMPAGFALAWVLTDWAPYGWPAWAATLLVMQALAGLGMLRLLVSMFGRRPFVLVLLAAYLAYVITLPAGIWWAAGINQLPLQIALVFGLHAFLAHLRTHRLRPLLVAVAWTVAGLLFYEKTVLLIGIYALVTLGWFSAGKTPERLRTVWETYRTAVVVWAVVGGAYVALYVEYGLNFGPSDTAAQPWSPIAWNLLGVALATALIGGPFRWEPLSVGSFADPTQLVMMVSWAAFAALASYAYRTRTLSKRAWAPLVFTSLANVALLASARANIVGPDIAREYRYQTESAALVVLGVGLAFLPLLGAREQNLPREDVPLTYDTPRLVAAVAAVLVATSAYSSVRYVELWQDRNPTRDFVEQVEASLDEAPVRPTPLVDTGIPQTLLWSYRFPENTYSHVFRNLADRMDFPAATLDNLYQFDDTGRIWPVSIPPTRSMVPAEGCGYALDRDGAATVPLDGPVIGGGWWVQIGYVAARDTTVRFRAGEVDEQVELPAGIHNVYLALSGEFDEIEMSTPGGEDAEGRRPQVCVAALTLGLPQPTIGAGS